MSDILGSLVRMSAAVCGLYYKCFMIVSYDRNDSGLYYKTTIVYNLALAWIVNYDHKLH